MSGPNSRLIRPLLLTAALALPELVLVAVDPMSPWRWLTKPLPMLFLIGWLGAQPKALSTGRLVIVALVLSLIGDLLLLNSGQGFFLAGLGSFLTAHLCYMVAFWRQRGPVDALMANVPRLAFVFGIFSLAVWMLVSVLGQQRLGPMFAPVSIYVGVITAMVISAMHRLRGVSDLSYRLVMAGALFFMLSDCLLAVSLFVTPFWISAVWIMLTYFSAQSLIVVGYREAL